MLHLACSSGNLTQHAQCTQRSKTQCMEHAWRFHSCPLHLTWRPPLVHCLIPQVCVADGSQDAAAPLSDDAIAQLLQQHLGIGSDTFLTAAKQQPPRSSTTSNGQAKQQSSTARSSQQAKPGRAGPKGGAPSGHVAAYESVEAFVGVMGRLLDMEREAEVAAAQEATSLTSTAAAQVHTAGQRTGV